MILARSSVVKVTCHFLNALPIDTLGERQIIKPLELFFAENISIVKHTKYGLHFLYEMPGPFGLELFQADVYMHN